MKNTPNKFASRRLAVFAVALAALIGATTATNAFAESNEAIFPCHKAAVSGTNTAASDEHPYDKEVEQLPN